jgi:O-antigen/teichoic acid export membrane protein
LALETIIAAMIRGFKKMQYTVIARNIVQPGVRLILTITLAVVIGLNAARALVSLSASTIIASLVLLIFLDNLFSLKRPLREARRDTSEVMRFSLPIYLSSLIGTFGGNLQSVLLGALNTVASVGIFGVASQVNLVGSMFHESIVTASAPIVSELHDQGSREQMEHFYQAVTKWTFTLTLPLFLIVILFPAPILSIFGKSFAGGAAALTVLAWANLANTGTGICGTVLDMSGKTFLKLVNSFAAFVLALGLNVLLIPKWGLVGAAVATLVSAAVINVLRLVEVFVLFRLLPYNLSFIKPIVAGLTASAIAWVLHPLSPSDANLIFAAATAAIMLVVYGGMILLLGLSEEDRMVLNRVGWRVNASLKKRNEGSNLYL